MDVTWDGTTKSVYLWDKIVASDTYLMEVCPPYDGYCMSTETFEMAGKTYQGFSLYNNQTAYALINLNSKYSTVNMTVAPVDGADISGTVTVNFYLDGRNVKSIEIEKGDYPTEISLPLNNALQMKVEMDAASSTTEIGFGNITVK